MREANSPGLIRSVGIAVAEEFSRLRIRLAGVIKISVQNQHAVLFGRISEYQVGGVDRRARPVRQRVALAAVGQTQVLGALRIIQRKHALGLHVEQR